MKSNFCMRDIRIKLLILGVVFSVSSVLMSAHVKAQNNGYHNDFVLEPGKMEVFVNPGDEVTRDIVITNRMPTATTFRIETEDFIGTNEKDTVVVLLGNEKSPYSLKDELIPTENEVTIGSGQKIDVPIKIHIPANAQPGGYYGSVLVSNQPSVDRASDSATSVQGATRIVSRVGVLFFVRVNGAVEEKGFLEDFYMQNRRTLFSTGPYIFESAFQNDGTVHLVPYGMVTIRNLFGSVIGTVPVDAYFAMPKSVRYRELTWNTAPFLFGRYTATLEMHPGFGSDIDVKSFAFWVIPWKFVIIALVSLLVIVTASYIFFSKFELRKK